MKTLKLSLLFLLIPLITLGQGNCLNDQAQVYVDIWAIGGQTQGTYTFEIQSVSGTQYIEPQQLSAQPNNFFYGCLDNTSLPYTWFIVSYDTLFPFNGDVNIYFDNEDGQLLFDGNNGQTSDSFTLNPVTGCNDNEADNYDPNVTLNDGSCEYSGCTDLEAFNYDSLATDDDGTCYPIVNGCLDSTAYNFNDYDQDGNPNPITGDVSIDVNTDDGSCLPIIVGCIDSNACNYNDAVNTNDTTCVFLTDDCASCSGETDGTGIILYNDDDGDGICNNDEVPGCTNPIALNYNPNASDNNGSCVFPQFQGCIDSIACNFDLNATITNNNCVYAVDECDICSGETDGTGIVIDNDQDNDGVCDANEIYGCTDYSANNFNEDATEDDGLCTYDLPGCINESACNYNENANTDDGSCTYAENYYDCEGDCLSDIDNDGICDQLESEGCTQQLACNFNQFITEEDGSCEFTSCYGCIEENACNFNENAYYAENCIYASDVSDCATCSGEQDGTGTIVNNDLDGDDVCDIDEIIGCTDATACNYDSTPTTDADNSLCNYSTDLDECATCSGEQDGTGIIINNDFDGDGVCNSDEIVGCTDSIACNYNPLTTDEGECNFALEYYDCNGNCLNDIDDNLICDEFQVEGCTDQDACNWDSDANVNDGSCDFPEEYYDCSGNCINDSDSNGICDELEVSGCTDPEACNFNPNATSDNGACEYLNVTLEYNNLSASLQVISNALLPSFQWNVNGENTNINSNRLNPFINGLYTVSVYDEENDCWGEASYSVNDVSLKEVSSDIKVFPNPVLNTLQITSKLNNHNTSIKIYNYLGKLIDAYENKNSQHALIDVSKLSSGIYIVKLKSEDFIFQKEFLKY